MKRGIGKFMELNVSPLIQIIQNNDTNYIVGFIVALLAAKSLQLKQEDKFYFDELYKKDIMLINTLFLLSIIVIGSYNLVLGMILAILFISINI